MATAAGSVEKVQVSEAEISQLADAKKRLLAKAAKLQAALKRAKAAGNTKVATEIQAELKEADGYRAQIGSIEATIKPFLDAYSAARLWVSDFFSSTLGELGAFWIPAIAAAGIATVVYSVNAWDRKTETSLQRYEAELKAHDEWVKRGKTDAEATSLVKETAKQYSKEQESKPGIFSELSGMVKLAGLGLLAFGAWQILQKQKSNTRQA